MTSMSEKFGEFKNNLHDLKEEHPVWFYSLKWTMIILIIILVILLILFILVFIVFPMVFMFCVALQRLAVFWNIDRPSNPEFDKPEKYGYKGVTNFFVTSTVGLQLNGSDVSRVGAWWMPQESYINSTQNMNQILAKNTHPVLLYNHGILQSRIIVDRDYVYGTLRKFFHVIAIDYRNYGDSSSIDLTEDGVMIDVVHTYMLMKTKTTADIYVWGHSLGGGISTHAVKWLKDNLNEIPAGLIIESSFTSLQDEIYEFALAKIFRWLPWFELCIINPIHNNGFIFNTTRNIQDVDCPIMMMHAQDDPVIPFFLGEKNYKQTREIRKPDQGNVSFHPFAASKHYGHVGCLQDPNVPKYIEDFMNECDEWKTNFRMDN